MATKKKANSAYKLLAILTAAFLVAVLGTAGLLQYYGKVVGEVNVSQSVVLVYDGNEYTYTQTVNFGNFRPVVAGSALTLPKQITIRNKADTLSANVGLNLTLINAIFSREVVELRFNVSGNILSNNYTLILNSTGVYVSNTTYTFGPIPWNGGSVQIPNTNIQISGWGTSELIASRYALKPGEEINVTITVIFNVTTTPGTYSFEATLMPA